MKHTFFKKSALVLTAAAMLAGMTACASVQAETRSVIGGDAICYSYCVYNEQDQLATIPVISAEPVTSAKLEAVLTDNDDVFTFTESSFDLSETFEYNGYHVYFLILNIKCNQFDTFRKVNVNAVTLNINGEIRQIQTPHFQITNGVEGIDPANYDTGDVLYGGNGYVVMFHSEMPSDRAPAELGITAQEPLTLDSYSIQDYFTIKTMYDDDKQKLDPANLNVTMEQDDDFVAYYVLDYANGSDETAIVRAAQILTYTDQDKKGAFISGAGEYLYLGQNEQTVIKNYIDKHR